jgi:hypothetical protein
MRRLEKNKTADREREVPRTVTHTIYGTFLRGLVIGL